MDQRQQNSTAHSVLFFMADSSDHVSGKTGLTPVVTLSKNGGAFAAAAGTVSEVGQGWYALAGNATDRNTLGELIIHGEASGADPSDRRLTIVPWDPFDSNLGLPRLDAAISSRAERIRLHFHPCHQTRQPGRDHQLAQYADCRQRLGECHAYDHRDGNRGDYRDEFRRERH